ncbi:protein TolQ [Desulfurivibrio alkaliphilus]|uniref:Protein TolQ n=1 Tax=Desulfurivibrio alkaliphilus (strain DSM 19089 / UNIQEM U267 / AHT2) TaxID=589865 RepID=D6Z215_DESAT|nr:protein TolQ [Desulfurivibrio alkaliphilus]ADH85590.1 protein TolQ [Desulfurivibrio alkaliphilus AHT 2]
MELNVFTMFLEAGPTIKAVILLLLVMSLYSWFIVFQKEILYRKVRQASEEFKEQFWKCRNLAEAHKTAKQAELAPEAMIFRAAYQELQKLNKAQGGELRLEQRLAGMEPLKRAAGKARDGEIAQLASSLPFLASTGSASPFIGLFGTVWGIMTAFHEIGVRGSASLAVVAPGISEALVVTAMGLAVAIPAVVFYNYYTNRLAQIEDNSQAFVTDFINLIERDFLTRPRGTEKQE